MALKRIWHGWTTLQNADRCQALLHDGVFPGIAAKRIPGYRSIEPLRLDSDDETAGTRNRPALRPWEKGITAPTSPETAPGSAGKAGTAVTATDRP